MGATPFGRSAIFREGQSLNGGASHLVRALAIWMRALLVEEGAIFGKKKVKSRLNVEGRLLGPTFFPKAHPSH